MKAKSRKDASGDGSGTEGQRRQSGRGQSGRKLRPGFGTRLRNYFFAGVLVTAPISITFWLAWKAIAFVDDRVTPFIPNRWNPETYLPFGLPGLGILVVMLLLVIVGFFAAGYTGRLLMRVSDTLLARVPVVSSIYSWTKQVFETVLQKSSAFRDVVLVEYPRRGSWAVGFITGRTEGEVQELTAQTVVNVFIPATPNPTTGFLLFVPEKEVYHLDMTVEEGIKLVISGGILKPPREHHDPEGHSPADSDGAKVVPVQASAESEAQEARATGRRVKRRRIPERRTVTGELMKRIGLMARLRNYFFAGVLVTAPLAITIWITWEIVAFVDSRVTPFIPAPWNPETYLPFGIPGLGVLVVFLVLVMVGFLAAGVVGRIVVRTGERLVDQMPVIRSVYAATKQIFEAVFRSQSEAFRECVLLEYPRRGCWAIGFVTGVADDSVVEHSHDDSTNIFLPTTPNPTSGFLLFVPRRELLPLGMTVEEGIKMVVSGGIVTPPAPVRTGEGAADERASASESPARSVGG